MVYDNTGTKIEFLRTKKGMIIVIIIILFMFVLGLYFQFERDGKMKNSKVTFGIIIERNDFIGAGAGAIVKFNSKNKSYESFIKCDCRELNNGDTVRIKYSIDDPSLVQLISKNFR